MSLPHEQRPPREETAATDTLAKSVDDEFSGPIQWRLHLTNASRVTPQQVRWCWDGLIPLGTLSLLVGPAGLGKSTLTDDLAARVSRGQLGRKPANVIIATSENSLAHTTVPRLIAAGADLERIDFATINDNGAKRGLTLPEDIDDLEEAVIAVGAELVILDPVVSHISDGIDSHKDHSVRRALDPISALADRTGAAILGVGHLNKSLSSDLLHRLAGSIGFGAAARSVLLFALKPGELETSAERVLIHGKCNMAPLAVPRRFRVEARTIDYFGEKITTSGHVWLGEDPTVTTSSVLSARREDTDGDERSNVADVLLAALEDGNKTWEELATSINAALGVSEATARRVRTELQKEGMIDKRKDGLGPWVWNLLKQREQVQGEQVQIPGLTWENPSGVVELAQGSNVSKFAESDVFTCCVCGCTPISGDEFYTEAGDPVCGAHRQILEVSA